MKQPTGIAIVVIIILLGSAILLGSGRIPGIPGIPLFSKKLTIDESWYIVYNHKAQYDTWSANQLRDHYGATLISIYTTNTAQFNETGRNLLFIGGSKEFAGKVPWAQKWPTLSMIQPGTYPNVYITNDGTWDNLWIQTPVGKFYTVQDREWLHDYGLIARGYDSELDRWIIVAVGHTGACTGAAAKLLIDNFGAVQSYSWLIIEIPKEIWDENQNEDLWSLALFEPVIRAHG